jgi:hypothetical protein
MNLSPSINSSKRSLSLQAQPICLRGQDNNADDDWFPAANPEGISVPSFVTTSGAR